VTPLTRRMATTTMITMTGAMTMMTATISAPTPPSIS
jgi:hypothetical protein